MWYEKFKKVIKAILIILVIVGAVGSYVFYIVCPEQAKLLIEEVKDFATRPVPVVGFSIGAAVVGLLTIISKTSWGRKTVKELSSTYNELHKEFAEYKENSEKLLQETKDYYEEKLELVEYNRKQERNLITKALSNIHNIRVEAALKEYKSLVSTKSISEVVEAEKLQLEKDYEAKFESFTQALLKDYESKMAEIATKTTQEHEELVKVVEDTKEEEKVAE